MIRKEFDEYCDSLKATTNVIQWGGASVWKVGGKMFAICAHWGEGEGDKIKFKCSDNSYELLLELPGVVPAPYLARAKWVAVTSNETLTDDDIKSYVEEAHGIIAGKLTKKLQRELALIV
jgi:predicted DNA-binding protein (MmcQ/YjbR family)